MERALSTTAADGGKRACEKGENKECRVGLAHAETTIFSSGLQGGEPILQKWFSPHKLNTPTNYPFGVDTFGMQNLKSYIIL